MKISLQILPLTSVYLRTGSTAVLYHATYCCVLWLYVVGLPIFIVLCNCHLTDPLINYLIILFGLQYVMEITIPKSNICEIKIPALQTEHLLFLLSTYYRNVAHT